MKRDIKFRAYIKDEGRLLNVNLIDFDDEYVRVWDEYGEDEEEWLFKDCELMRYTGMDDVNGKPIYEGDIVKAYRTCKSDLITFANGSFGIAPDYWHSFESFTNFYGKCEVIGNKFQNPELLEVSE
ncbi:YopX family protein [Latilactobacillus fuchuensis]|uniref:YopX family protein n=1 Tax=Latilactobacillus fuchuensis TaxID=164393 RepID=UPI0039AE99C1